MDDQQIAVTVRENPLCRVARGIRLVEALATTTKYIIRILREINMYERAPNASNVAAVAGNERGRETPVMFTVVALMGA